LQIALKRLKLSH